MDRSLPLADIARAAADRLTPAFDAGDAESRIALASEALAASLESRRTVVTESADAIVRHWGMIPVGVLAAGAGLGTRQLERRFLDEVGMTPKRLARISRFQRVFHAMERRPVGWTRVAVECGYYDSSHLVRDFQEFAGDAPSRAVAAGDELTLAFTARVGQSVVGSSVRPPRRFFPSLLAPGSIASGMRSSLFALCALLFAPRSPLTAQTLKDFAWLAGSRSMKGNALIEERWTDPASNMMLGLSRTVRGDKVVEFEFLRIEARPDGLFYVAQPGGHPPTDFKLTKWDGTEAIFENPSTIFPSASSTGACPAMSWSRKSTAARERRDRSSPSPRPLQPLSRLATRDSRLYLQPSRERVRDGQSPQASGCRHRGERLQCPLPHALLDWNT